MSEVRLIDKRELMQKHPALKGNSKWRIEWLIRTRQIPTVRIGGRIYFNEAEIDNWVRKNSVQPKNGER